MPAQHHRGGVAKEIEIEGGLLMTSKGVRDHPYLIVGGTTKAATSSLFAYLKDHPEVCGANIKEVGFFVDKDYPLKIKYRFEDGIERYEEFFTLGGGGIRVEATPDYLHSPGTAERIHKTLSDVRFIFILRDPVKRLVSWYRFACQNSRFPKKSSFDEYVNDQKQGLRRDEHYMYALEQGHYAEYIQQYLKLFGKGRVLVLIYEDLLADPREILKRICYLIGIDPAFYDDYKFKVYNRTLSMRNAWIHGHYYDLKLKVGTFTHDKPLVQKIFRIARMIFEPLYLSLNEKRRKEWLEVSPETRSFLRKYYEMDVRELERIIDRKIPWKLEV